MIAKKPLNEERIIRKFINDYLRKKSLLREYATLNDPSDSLPSTKYKVDVYPKDRTTMTPHFHFYSIDKTFSLEIQIENIKELKVLKSSPRKGIPKNRLNTWDGLTYEKKLLGLWLNEASSVNTNLTNYDFIVAQWKIFNK